MWGEDGACWMAWPCHALSVCFCLSWRWWWWWCSVFAAIPLAMAFACGSASCVTGSTLQWRSSAPTGDRSRRLLASSSSQLVTLDAALLRLRIAAPGHPVRRQAQGPRAMVPLEPIILAPPEIDATTFVLGSLVTGALSFGVFRTVVYFRMQLIIAHMLALHVPKGGARVVDFSVGEGRNLYYYPKDTVQVVGVNPNPKVPMLEAQAAYAKVPIRILPDVSRLPANSMDAVVSVQGMEDMSDEQVETVLRDAVRVLKPGKKFIYIENVGAENPLVLAAQQSIEGLGKLFGKKYTVTRDLLSFILKTKGFEVIKYQVVLGFQDPHIVGIATKKQQTTTGAGIGKDTIPKKNKKEKVPQQTGLSDPQKIEFSGQ